MWKQQILTSLWSAQHPNAGQNIQQKTRKKLSWYSFPFFPTPPEINFKIVKLFKIDLCET